MSADDLTAMFAELGERGPWRGGDSTASVPLPGGRTAWLFSDTLLAVPDGDPVMISNSMVVQGEGRHRVIHGGTKHEPQALITSPYADEFCWIGSGSHHDATGVIQVLVNRYVRIGTGQFDFALTGTALAELTYARDATRAHTLPLGDRVAWGSAIVKQQEYLYVFGSEWVARTGRRYAHLARVRGGFGGLAGPWSFWRGSGWSAHPADSVRVATDVGTAFGVQRLGGRWVLVTFDGRRPFSPQVVMWSSAALTGPWRGPDRLFKAPGADRPGLITYDARVHPHLARTGRLMVSYNVNTLGPPDARVYRPKFVESQPLS